MGTTQAQLHSVVAYQLGDCLRDTSSSTSEKLILVECPICRIDPTRPRYFFDETEKRPSHFVGHP